MHPTNVIPVWKIVLQYALASKEDLTSSFIVDIIERQSVPNEVECGLLAKLFNTSQQYWTNLTIQTEEAQSKLRNALNSIVQDTRNMSSEELKTKLKESEKSPLAQVINQFQQDEYTPCPDMSEEAQTEQDAFTYVINTSGVSKIHLKPFSQEFEAQNLYIMTEQAYKYMLSKCTKDELWDMGILGQSEEHVKKVESSQTLQNKIKRYYGNGLETAR